MIPGWLAKRVGQYMAHGYCGSLVCAKWPNGAQPMKGHRRTEALAAPITLVIHVSYSQDPYGGRMEGRCSGRSLQSVGRGVIHKPKAADQLIDYSQYWRIPSLGQSSLDVRKGKWIGWSNIEFIEPEC